MPVSYPWSILEIEPTDDQTVIRKAYAAKLKVTRPDEDPEGFQALVEARDRAFLEARHLYTSTDCGDESGEETASTFLHRADESVRHEARGEEPAKDPVEADSSQRQAAGSIIVDDGADGMETQESNTDSHADDDDETDAFHKAFAALGRQHPWETLEFQWGAVFNAIENAPLSLSGIYFSIALQRLAHDLENHKGALGPYKTILSEFEKRFSVLRHDRILVEHLGEWGAQRLIELLEHVVGGRETVAPRKGAIAPPLPPIPHIDMDDVEAAFPEDPKMIAYRQTIVDERRYALSFSLEALVSPLTFTLANRMYAGSFLAFFFLTTAVAQFALIDKTDKGSGDLQFLLFLLCYFATAVGIALYWRRFKLDALYNFLRRLDKKTNLSREERTRRLVQWGKPNRIGDILGRIYLVLLLVAILYSHAEDFGLKGVWLQWLI